MTRHLVRIAGGGEVICAGDEPVLIAMERQGLARIPIGCRGGGCGVCKVKVLEGTYTLGKMSRVQVDEKEEKQGIALACKIYPTSTLLVEPIGKLSMRVG